MKRKISLEVIISLIVLLMLYAAISKLIDLKISIFQIRMSPFSLFKEYGAAVAIIVPVLEIIIALLLFFERTRYTGLIAFIILMSIFSVYIASMLISGLKLPCACGGILRNMSWQAHLYFNLAYIGLATIGIRLLKKIRVPGHVAVIT